MDESIKTVLTRLAEGRADEQDLAQIRKALENGNLALASGGGIGVGGNVEGSFVLTGENINIALPESFAEKLIDYSIPQMVPKSQVHMIGREKDVQKLIGKLTSENKNRNILALRGMGGIGKTTLAIALAYHPSIVSAFPDGELWACLGPDPDIMTWLAAWGRQLGKDLSDYPIPAVRSSALTSALHGKKILLLIDDVWEAEDARPFLVGDVGSVTIITTRDWHVAQNLAGEGNQPIELLDDKDSLELLTSLAPEAIRENPTGAQELAQSLGGLPLALTLAGSLIREEWQIGFGTTGVLNDLKNREERLALEGAESRQGLPLKNISIQSVLGMSYDHLKEDSWRRAFRFLGAIGGAPNTFSLAMAGAIWELDERNSQKIIVKLVQHALVENQGAGRFMLHQTLHDYASSLLALDETEEQNARLNSVTFALQLARQYSRENVSRWREFDVDWENIRQAMNWLAKWTNSSKVDRGKLELCADMVNALDYAIRARHPSESIEWLEAGQKACHHLERKIEEGWLSLTGGEISINIGNLNQAYELIQHSMKVFQEVGEISGLRYAQGNLGILHYLRGENELAVTAFLSITQDLISIGDQKGAAVGYFNLGNAYYRLERYEDALNSLRECIRLLIEAGSMQEYLALATCNLVQIYLATGNMIEAKNNAEKAMILANSLGLEKVLGLAYQIMGEYLAFQGNMVEAQDYFEQSIDYYQKIGLREGLAEAYETYGRALQRNHNQNQAVKNFENAIKILNGMGATSRVKKISQLVTK